MTSLLVVCLFLNRIGTKRFFTLIHISPTSLDRENFNLDFKACAPLGLKCPQVMQFIDSTLH